MNIECLTEQDIKIIKGYARCNMNRSKTAEYLYMHKNNVVYHLERIKEKTGLDPKVFYDLVELLDLLREEK